MLNGRLSSASTSADWVSEDIAARDEDGALVDLTGLRIDIEVQDRHGAKVLSGSTADGVVSIDGSVFSWVFPEAQMRALVAETHRVFIRIKDTVTGDIEQAVVADIHIYEGGFR